MSREVYFKSDAQRRAIFASLSNRFSNSAVFPGENIASSIVGLYPDRSGGNVGIVQSSVDIGDAVVDYWPDETGPAGTSSKFDDAIVGLWPMELRDGSAEFDAAINDLIVDQLDFISTENAASPSLKTGDQLADIAAVVAGSKPAAIVSVSHQDPRQPILIEKALGKGYIVEMNPVYDQVTNERIGDEYIVGKPENVRALMKLLDVPKEGRNDEYHRVFGRALGYHPAAIEDFIRSLRVGSVESSDVMVV